MSWKDNLQQASFREVKFLVKSHSVNLGRRVVSHEFPFGDKPFTEDLG
ncbi:MAG: DNA circularization N-terminal domain-containing protein, partial [Bdellovibrionota bacterium]